MMTFPSFNFSSISGDSFPYPDSSFRTQLSPTPLLSVSKGSDPTPPICLVITNLSVDTRRRNISRTCSTSHPEICENEASSQMFDTKVLYKSRTTLELSRRESRTPLCPSFSLTTPSRSIFLYMYRFFDKMKNLW